MKKYELRSWKLTVSGEFETEEEAIKVLSDAYMERSPCDWPKTSPLELLTGTERSDPAKDVYLFVEHEVFGIKQMVQKLHLNIYPRKSTHWWDTMGNEVLETAHRYKTV